MAALAAAGTAESVEGTDEQNPISRKAADSIKPYDDKYYAALKLLDKYVATNASTGTQAEAGAPRLHREPDDRNKMNAGAC